MKQYVYVMRCGAGFYKIGRSRNPEARRRNLETSRGHDDVTIVYLCGPFNLAGTIEIGAHALLKHCRMNGEWFSCSEKDAISAVKQMERGFSDAPDADPNSKESQELTHWMASGMTAPHKKAVESFGAAVEWIERISATRDTWEQNYRDAMDIVAELKSEVGRLKAENARLSSAIQPSLLN